MSFANFHRVIKENDTVILYLGISELFAIEVKPQILNRHGTLVPNIFQTKYGALTAMSLVGREFGSRVQLTRGWGIILYPTPELWTLTLEHRTQILYSTDIIMIIGLLGIGPGSVVCEAGTGSGSLSHAILRTLGHEGHLHTSDFHKQRAEAVEEDFRLHGLSDRVTVTCRDVFTDGWPVVGAADAVFVDLPRAFLTLHHAINATKPTGGRICTFSPCIEQVSQNTTTMRRLGLQGIRTMEVLVMELQVKQMEIPSITIQQDDRPFKNFTDAGETQFSKRQKVEDTDNSADIVNGENAPEADRPKTATETEQSARDDDVADTPTTTGTSMSTTYYNSLKKITKSKRMLLSIPMLKQGGHTGYLTICFVPPGIPRPVAPVHLETEQR